MNSSGRLLSSQWVVTVVGGLVVAILAALVIPMIHGITAGQHGAGSEVTSVSIPINSACEWAYPGQATGSTNGSDYNIVCLGVNGESLGGFPDRSGHSLNDWCSDSTRTEGMDLEQAALTSSGWVCTVLR
jgi:hypothetical protein